MRSALILAAVIGCSCGGDVPILLYHSVGQGNASNWDADPEQFRMQMDELVRLGYRTVSLSELMDAREHGTDLPDKSVVITFDDGDRTVYTTAFPILRERGLKAELFLIAGLVGENIADRHAWQDVGRFSMLVWPEVEEMVAAGTFEIGAHSMTHPALGKIPFDQARTEIFDSRQLISDKLGRPVDFFAFPYHNRSGEVLGLVRGAGYRGAVAGKNGGGGDFEMSRLNVHRSMKLEEFRELIGAD